jgi:transposase
MAEHLIIIELLLILSIVFHMGIDVTKLPDDATLLKQLLEESHARFDRETSILLEQISHLRAQLFGRKSEKLFAGAQAVPLPLFDMPETAIPEEEKEDVHIPAHNRKKSGRKPLPEELPRIDIVHDIDESEKICGCGCELSKMGEDVSEQLDVVPARIQVLRHIRPKYACKKCDGLEDNGPTVKIAPVAPQVIPKSIAGPGLLAFILTGKFVDHLPFYRQEKQFKRLGVELSRTLMCNWAIKAAAICQPLLNLMQDEMLDGKFINIDETTVQVLKETGRNPTTKSYMWVFRRGDPGKTTLIFQYHPTRAGAVVKLFLDDFKGYVQTDGYTGYDFLDHKKEVRHIGCFAHARRNFADIIKSQGKKRKPGSADIALSFIRNLYKIEKELRAKEASVEEIYRTRQEKAKPILDDFKTWLDKRVLEVTPQSMLGKAVTYCLNQWSRLIGYVDHGCLSIDNNAAENAIRPFVIGRKNWLFSGTPEGAEASALFYSLIETAKANGVEPYSYLRYVLTNIPMAQLLEDYEALLPWNVKGKLNPVIM